MNTRMHVADNAPPQNVGEHLHAFFGGLDGQSLYDEQAAAVDRLMADYESASVDNEQRFDSWSVPPTVVVTPAEAAGDPADQDRPRGRVGGRRTSCTRLPWRVRAGLDRTRRGSLRAMFSTRRRNPR